MGSLAAGHPGVWPGYWTYYTLLAWVMLATGGLAGWMVWEDMGGARRTRVENRRGDMFVAGVPKKILLMGWFMFAYRAVEVALSGAAVVMGVGSLMRGGVSWRAENPAGPLPWYAGTRTFTEGGCFGLG